MRLPPQPDERIDRDRPVTFSYYGRFLRNVAGLGRVDRHARTRHRFDTEHRRAEVLVIGAGESGVEAARRHAAAGRQVVLVDELGAPDVPGVEVLAPARALGV